MIGLVIINSPYFMNIGKMQNLVVRVPETRGDKSYELLHRTMLDEKSGNRQKCHWEERKATVPLYLGETIQRLAEN